MIQLTIDSTTVPVQWEDNASVSALAAQVRVAPLEIGASRYGGFEQVGALGRTLPRDDEQVTTKPGDVMLYSGNQLVLFFGANTWSYTRLGRINLATSNLRELLDKNRVKITLAADGSD